MTVTMSNNPSTDRHSLPNVRHQRFCVKARLTKRNRCHQRPSAVTRVNDFVPEQRSFSTGLFNGHTAPQLAQSHQSYLALVSH